MPSKKLTERNVTGLKPGAKKYKVWDTVTPGLAVIVLPSGVKSYAYFYRVNGRAQEKVLGRTGALCIADARTMSMAMGAAARQGQDPGIKRNPTLGHFIDSHYRAHVERHHRRAKETLRVLELEFAGLHSKPLDKITLADISRYEAARPHLARSTLDRQVTDLSAALNWAIDAGLIDTNPLARRKRQKADHGKVVRYLAADEEGRLYAALESRQDRQRAARSNHQAWARERGQKALPDLTGRFTDHLMPLVTLALNTGMRRGEIFALGSADLVNGEIIVHGSGAKSGKTRRIPMNATVRQLLADWPHDGLVFPSPATGRKLTNIDTAWRHLLREADIEDFRFHDCRHHFATKLVERGVALTTVQQLLGHSDITLTTRYAHTSDAALTAAVNALE